jgi:hypothetical protein
MKVFRTKHWPANLSSHWSMLVWTHDFTRTFDEGCTDFLEFGVLVTDVPPDPPF